MTKLSICVLGGTGFIGRALLLRLAEAGFAVTVVTRHKSRHTALLNYPGLKLVEANPHDSEALHAVCRDHQVIINLIGVLNDGKGNHAYQQAHVNLARTLVQAIEESDVQQLIHVSAQNADASLASSAYLQSKGEAEGIFKVQTARQVATTVFRPSVVFGQGGGFVQLFSSLLSKLLVLPLACPKATVAPVWVEDVVSAIVAAINNPQTYSQAYDLCGDTHTMHEVVQLIKQAQKKRTYILPLPAALSKLQAMILGWMPGRPFTLDNYDALQHPPHCTRAPDYLGEDYRFKPFSQWVREQLATDTAKERYSDYRKEARR